MLRDSIAVKTAKKGKVLVWSREHKAYFAVGLGRRIT